MRTLTTLEELDEKLAECEQAARISDDELRRVFQTFRMDLSARLPPDPFSLEYANVQMELYERVAGHSYKTSNEESIFDLESAITRPFPYTGSCQTAGVHLSALGFLLRQLQPKPKARILDLGAGWGNSTLALAQLGFEVTALDIEPRFCELIRQRCRRVGVHVEIVNSDFFWTEKVTGSFDAIVAFECFHHCADHMRLLRALRAALEPGGHIYFGAEPITPDFPIPWGLRGDGESLWAIRRNGWLELGFHPDYFREALQRAGMIAEVYTSADLPWINVWVARARLPEAIRSPATDPVILSQTMDVNQVSYKTVIGELPPPECVPAAPRRRSQLCKQADFALDSYRYWSSALKLNPTFHRKHWEFFYICQALRERSLLEPGRTGLGFGVGREPLPALFVSLGCTIVATDQAPEAAIGSGWQGTGQHAEGFAALERPDICDATIFRQHASFEAVDMNHIPDHLANRFDFCWSACCFEHLGSLELGLRFVENSLNTLKAGGVAVHTTEFNLSSNADTLESQNLSIYRKSDIEFLAIRLEQAGHRIEPLDFTAGTALADGYVDLPPYRNEPHLRLRLGEYDCTSIGLIISRGK